MGQEMSKHLVLCQPKSMDPGAKVLEFLQR